MSLEVNSQRDKSEISSNDSESYTLKSIKLKSHKRSHQKNKTQHSQSTESLKSSLMSSITRKLRINSIKVYSKGRLRTSDPISHEFQIQNTCFPVVQYRSQLTKYSDILSQSKNTPNIIENTHLGKGQRRGCFEQICPIKKQWIKSIIFYQKQLKNLMILKQKIPLLSKQVKQQIDKDIHRTFPLNVITKTKLNISQNLNDKYNLIDNLKQVLRLYSVLDQEMGYVQGMNLIADINSSFIFFKEIMYYGKLRQFYIDDFKLLKQEVGQLLHGHLRRLNNQLYLHLIKNNVDCMMFLPYYLTLFASFLDINYMHIIINLYMRQGVRVLHKIMITILLYLQPFLMQSDESSILLLLSNTKLKCLPWAEILQSSMGVLLR